MAKTNLMKSAGLKSHARFHSANTYILKFSITELIWIRANIIMSIIRADYSLSRYSFRKQTSRPDPDRTITWRHLPLSYLYPRLSLIQPLLTSLDFLKIGRVWFCDWTHVSNVAYLSTFLNVVKIRIRRKDQAKRWLQSSFYIKIIAIYLIV